VTPTARRDALAEEARGLEAAIAGIGHKGAPNDGARRADLESRVARLCAEALALPAAEARSLTDAMVRLIDALEQAAERLRAMAPSGDSSAPAIDTRRAAAAYGDAAGRRRRGF